MPRYDIAEPALAVTHQGQSNLDNTFGQTADVHHLPRQQEEGTDIKVKEVVPLIRFWAMIWASNMSCWNIRATAANSSGKGDGHADKHAGS